MKQLSSYLLCNNLLALTTRVEVQQPSIDTILLQYPQGFRGEIIYSSGVLRFGIRYNCLRSSCCKPVKILPHCAPPLLAFLGATRRIRPKPRVPIPPIPRCSISLIPAFTTDRKSTRLNSSHLVISYA